MRVIDCDVGKRETTSWSRRRIFLTAMLFDKISLPRACCVGTISARKQWEESYRITRSGYSTFREV
jgi:hypothetical protein